MRVAVLGCGLIATRKYIPILQRSGPKVSLAGVCDLNEDVVGQVSSMFGIRAAYTDFGRMLDQERPEIVMVCTPPATHKKLVIEALESGAHVLVEKPMALTSGDCRDMVDSAHRHGRRLGVMHNQIFNPAFERACDMVADGGIGRFLGMRIFLMSSVHDMTTNRTHWAHRLPGGVIGETGPHAIYLSLALLSKVTEVQVCVKKQLPEYPWSAAEDIRFDLIADNGISSVALMYGSNQSTAEIEIIGTKGMLKVDLQSRILIDHNRAVGPELLSARTVTRSVLGNLYQTGIGLVRNAVRHGWSRTLDGHYIGIQRFLEHVVENAEYRGTGEKGRETTEVLEMVVRRLQLAHGAPAGFAKP